MNSQVFISVFLFIKQVVIINWMKLEIITLT